MLTRQESKSSVTKYNICSHRWSFLEGLIQNHYTLEAGRHIFPFQIRLGGSLPPSLEIADLGGLSVFYELEAVVLRRGVAFNMQATVPVHVMRSYSREASERHQTPKIEGCWPGKLNYSITIPHKAWAIGDKVPMICKFSSLADGLRVCGMTTAFTEDIKLCSQRDVQTHTRPLSGGTSGIVWTPRTNKQTKLTEAHASQPTVNGKGACGVPAEHNPSVSESQVDSRDIPDPHGHAASSPDLETCGDRPSTPITEESSAPPELDDNLLVVDCMEISDSATPSHSFGPITISHHLCFAISVKNDARPIATLRCSHPVRILDRRVFDEAANCAGTCRMLIDEARDNTDTENRVMFPWPEMPHGHPSNETSPNHHTHFGDTIPSTFPPELSESQDPILQDGNQYSPLSQSCLASLPDTTSDSVKKDREGSIPLHKTWRWDNWEKQPFPEISTVTMRPMAMGPIHRSWWPLSKAFTTTSAPASSSSTSNAECAPRAPSEKPTQVLEKEEPPVAKPEECDWEFEEVPNHDATRADAAGILSPLASIDELPPHEDDRE